MTNRFSFVDWVLVWAFWSACQSYKNHDCRGRIMIERYILPQKRGKENTNVPETRYSYFHLHFSTRKGKLGMGSKTSRESLSFGQTFLGPPPPPTSVCPCLSLLPQMFKFVVGLLFWQQKVKYLKSENLLCIWEIKQQKDRQQWTIFKSSKIMKILLFCFRWYQNDKHQLWFTKLASFRYMLVLASCQFKTIT